MGWFSVGGGRLLEQGVTVDLPVGVPRCEVLRYLGLPADSAVGPGLSGPLAAMINAAIAWATESLRPRGLFRLVGLTQPGPDQDGLTLALPGEPRLASCDVAALLAGATYAALWAVTVGPGLDERLAELTAAGEITGAAALDAVGSAAAEQAAEAMHGHLAALAWQRGFVATGRFSPGYGDFGLVHQRVFAEALDLDRIGVTLTPSLLLTPQKSITAVLGWRRRPDDAAPGDALSGDEVCGSRANGGRCQACTVRECTYRSPGDPR